MASSNHARPARRGQTRAIVVTIVGIALIVFASVASAGLLPNRERLVVVGDSLSTGLGTSAAASWPVLLERAEESGPEKLEVVNAAENGSGYVTPGDEGDTFGAEVMQFVNEDTKVVLFFGSDNDLGSTPAQITDAATTAFQAARAKAAPDARLIVVGPPAYTIPPDADIVSIRDALRTAADRSGAAFVDPIAEVWIAEHTDELIGPDGEHPTAAGHERLAQLMENVLER
ncbi:SGNH/GDSL hydrolase family protein [Sinomonas sp. P47F7]|uniref:SGNH/GDSL hydrolase family protein n=1 Tax=Sinomonas sp. P47F7 TaxID=3410987 RepID=UPI003BF4B078